MLARQDHYLKTVQRSCVIDTGHKLGRTFTHGCQRVHPNRCFDLGAVLFGSVPTNRVDAEFRVPAVRIVRLCYLSSSGGEGC